MRKAVALDHVPRMALWALSAHPLRAVLSVASFACAAAITVVLVAAGSGLKRAVSEILVGLGEGQIVALPGRTTGMGGQRRAGRTVQIRFDDLLDIADALPSFTGVAPYVDLRGGGASSYRYSIPWSPVRGVARAYQEARRMPVTEGRWFTDSEDREGRWVAVLNEGLRRMIFRDEPAVGEWVEWRGRKMTIVGVVRDEALFPYILFVPYGAARQIRDARYISGLVARPRSVASWDQAVAELRRVVSGVGNFDPADENALEIEDNREFTSRVATGTTALQLLIVTIAAVSLLLGGLGVAHMMVISVTERTWEIGLRKAVGATNRDVFLQILFETWTIVAAGSVLGIALGAVGCALLGEIQMSEKYVAEVRFEPLVALFSLGALTVIGTVAGAIPARRAAALSVAEALRWE